MMRMRLMCRLFLGKKCPDFFSRSVFWLILPNFLGGRGVPTRGPDAWDPETKHPPPRWERKACALSIQSGQRASARFISRVQCATTTRAAHAWS